MPIFEYKCSICSEITEKIQKEQEAEIMCKICAYPSFPILSLPGLMVFNGDGFEKPNRHLKVDKMMSNREQYGTFDKPKD